MKGRAGERTYASFAPAWWLRRAIPAPLAPEAAVAERERQRKAGILGVVLFFNLLLSLPLLGEYALTRSFLTFVVLVFIGMVFVAAAINRRGALQMASFFYLISYMTIIICGIWAHLPGSPLAFLWEWVLLVVPSLVAGLLLPFWTPFVFALANSSLITWLFFKKQATETMLRQMPLVSHIDFLLYVNIILFAVAILSAVYAYSVERAITEADRAAELEAAHGDLQTAHAALARAYTTLEELATHDPLTGLPNHRTLNERLAVELQRAERSQMGLAVLFLDIDHFKALNDTYGHPVGDEVLTCFAETIRGQLRAIDVVGRWGGEEFLGVLPDIESAAAQGVAERIRAAVASQSFSRAGGIHITCSIGLAFYPHHATSREALLAQADHAMYAAKKLGRNQVRVADELAVLALDAQAGTTTTREDQAVQGVVEALGAAIAARDATIAAHMRAVGHLARQIAAQMGLGEAECRVIELAGALHDIGKVAIPDAILHKRAPLTPDEHHIMRHHPLIGAEIIGHIPALRGLSAVVRAQHERWDGAGFPDGLAGEAIPLGARIIAVADAFDAHCRAAAPPFAAEVEREAAGQFDPHVVVALVALAEQRAEAQAA